MCLCIWVVGPDRLEPLRLTKHAAVAMCCLREAMKAIMNNKKSLGTILFQGFFL